MNNRLVQRIHAINPNLLIFANIEEWVLVYSDYTDIIEECAMAPMEPRVVFDSHHYCAEVPEGILYPEGLGGWLPQNCGWDYYDAYLAGRYAEAREKVDRWFNLTYLWIQQIYDVPIIIAHRARAFPYL